MTIQIPFSHTNRTALPRALIARRPVSTEWSFDIGEIADFGESFAIINGRTLSAAGRQLYEIELLNNDCGRPYRVVRAEGLKRVPFFDIQPSGSLRDENGRETSDSSSPL